MADTAPQPPQTVPDPRPLSGEVLQHFQEAMHRRRLGPPPTPRLKRMLAHHRRQQRLRHLRDQN